MEKFYVEKKILIAIIVSSFLLGFLTNAIIFQLSYNTKTNTRFANKLEELEKGRYEAEVNLVAVKQLGYVGVVTKATVEVVKGKGRVLFSINPFIEPDTQYSAETAVRIAEQITHKNLSNRDVIFTIQPPYNTKLIGGPSAGAALTIATIAAIEGKKVRNDVILTGTIEADGRIGKVGGVLEKAIAAAEENAKIFLVPKGEGTITYYEKVEKRRTMGVITIEEINYVPKTLELGEYLKQKGYETKVIEVSNIREAMKYMLS